MSAEMPIPIIRLEVEHLKHCILHAFSDYTLKFDETLKRAVEAYCTSATVDKVMTEAVEREMRTAIEQEIKDFFKYGEGREAVSAAVKARLTASRKPKKAKR